MPWRCFIVLFTWLATLALAACNKAPPELLFPPERRAARPKRNAGQIFIKVRGQGPGVPQVVNTVSLRRYLIAGKPRWWLDGPHVRADDDVCDGLFRALLEARVEERLSGKQAEAGRGGLSDGRYRVEVVLLPGGHTVRLGDDAGPGLVYASRDGKPEVLLVPAQLRELLAHDRDHFSLWTMADMPAPGAVRSLQLGDVLLTRGPSSVSWEVSQPATADHPARSGPARTAAVDSVLTALRTVRARRLLPDSGLRDPADFPRLRAPIVVDANVQSAPVVIRVDGHDQLYTGVPCPRVPGEVYAVRVDSARLCFAPEDIRKITPSYDELRGP